MVDIAHDLWNVFDLIALRPLKPFDDLANVNKRVVFVQVTDSTHHADRRNKIIASAEAKLCLLSGASILIQSWRKKDERWQAQDEWVSLDQFCVGLADTVEQFYEDEKRQKLLDRKSKLPDLPPGSTLPLSDYLREEEIPF